MGMVGGGGRWDCQGIGKKITKKAQANVKGLQFKQQF
jgi:hypothetical protein